MPPGGWVPIDVPGLYGCTMLLHVYLKSIKFLLHFTSLGGKIQRSGNSVQLDCIILEVSSYYNIHLKSSIKGMLHQLFKCGQLLETQGD